MTRHQALRAITVDALNGWGEPFDGPRIYVENRISRAAYVEAVEAGRRLADVAKALKHIARPHEGLGLVVYAGRSGLTRDTLELAEKMGLVRKFQGGWVMTERGFKTGSALQSAREPAAVLGM